MVAAIATARAENDVPQNAALDSMPTASLLQLCRDGSADVPMQLSVDVNAILQRHERALAACDKVIDGKNLAGRDLAEALLDRADLEAPGQQEAYARALADYARALVLAPNLAAAYWRRGKAKLLYARDLKAALDDLDVALRIDPSQPEFLVTRSSILAWLGRPDPALADLDSALQLDPGCLHALTNRGLAYSDRGDWARALVDFDAALRLSPDDFGLHGFRAAVRRRLGDEVGAKADEAKAQQEMFGDGPLASPPASEPAKRDGTNP